MSLALISGQLKSVALASTTKLMSLALVMKTKSLALDSETCPYWVNSRPTLIFDSLLLLCNINSKISLLWTFVHSENPTVAYKMFKQT